MLVEPIEPYIENLSQMEYDYSALCDEIRWFMVDAARNVNHEIPIDTISVADAILLYLLVRKLKPKVILEIGTWYGSSAYAMALGQEHEGIDGAVLTCDTSDVYYKNNRLKDRILYFNMHSDKFLRDDPDGDFIFIDANLTKSNAKKLNKMCTEGSILAFHDFFPNKEKGFFNVEMIDTVGENDFTLLEPSNPSLDGHYKGINSCTAVLMTKGENDA